MLSHWLKSTYFTLSFNHFYYPFFRWNSKHSFVLYSFWLCFPPFDTVIWPTFILINNFFWGGFGQSINLFIHWIDVNVYFFLFRYLRHKNLFDTIDLYCHIATSSDLHSVWHDTLVDIFNIFYLLWMRMSE